MPQPSSQAATGRRPGRAGQAGRTGWEVPEIWGKVRFKPGLSTWKILMSQKVGKIVAQ